MGQPLRTKYSQAVRLSGCQAVDIVRGPELTIRAALQGGKKLLLLQHLNRS